MLSCRCETRESSRISVRTRRSTGHAFFGDMVHQWQSHELFGAVILTRLLLTRLVPRVICSLGHATHKAGFSTKEGVLGLRTIADKSEAACIASQNATHFLCTQIRHSHRGVKTRVISICKSAVDALDIMVPGLDVATMEPDDITQSVLNKRINEQKTTNWRSEALPPERVHLQAYSAKGCGHEISLVPSKTLDTHLSPSEFVNTVSRRLGVDVMDSGRPCCFCGQPLGAQGSHCPSCMAGGDATTQHNAVRDVYFDFCERAGLRPISEAPHSSGHLHARWSLQAC